MFGYVISAVLFGFVLLLCFFFFKQKTAYEMLISDWSSDVCSSDLLSGATMPAEPNAAPAYHHGDLRRVLVDAATAIVAEEQNWEFSLREVARRDRKSVV